MGLVVPGSVVSRAMASSPEDQGPDPHVPRRTAPASRGPVADAGTVGAVTATIAWRVHVRAAKAAGRQRVLDQVVGALGDRTTLDACEPYWKDDRDHVATLTTELGGLGVAGAVLETLLRADRLRGGWHATGPHVDADGTWWFDLDAAADEGGGGFAVPGVVFVTASASVAATPAPGEPATGDPASPSPASADPASPGSAPRA